MRGRYAGVCYDGPLEGEHREHDGYYFRVAIQPRLSVWDFKPGICDTITTGVYVWSHPLRKWVFDWRST